jgi:hypothetical protein
VADDKDELEDEPSAARESTETSIAVLKEKVKLIAYVLRNNVVHKHEFTPVKLLVYGITAILLSSVVGAIVAYVIRRA